MSLQIVALAQRLRAHAELHNIFVRSERKRDKWFAMGLVSLATPYASAAAPFCALAWVVSYMRHNDVVNAGAWPIGHNNIWHFYVTRPSVPEIVSTVARLGSIELAEEALIDKMCIAHEHRHFLYPRNWYKAAADTEKTVKEDM